MCERGRTLRSGGQQEDRLNYSPSMHGWLSEVDPSCLTRLIVYHAGNDIVDGDYV